jgi:hypothetical protein
MDISKEKDSDSSSQCWTTGTMKGLKWKWNIDPFSQKKNVSKKHCSNSW